MSIDMEYEKQIHKLVKYFRNNEKNPSDFKIGIEQEHFILDKNSLEAVSYYGTNGIECILKELVHSGWAPVYEGKHIIQLQKGESTITLEPGGQVELSMLPQKSLKKIDDIYFSFLHDIIPVLEKWDKIMITTGYQPQTCIKDIPLLPKKRYEYMYRYFSRKGRLAHHMMKGTASSQVSIDYSNEEDYIKKNRVLNFLAPVIYCMFDNSPFFEGKVCMENSIRSIIWNNCDNDRCSIPDGMFSDNFSYQNYAEYILNIPPLIIKKNNITTYTGDKLLREIYNPGIFSKNETDYVLSMFFPDIRTQSYIEIRMGDALPYPYNIGYAALWKGLLYNSKNLDLLYEESRKHDLKMMNKMKEEIHEKGINTNINDTPLIQWFKGILSRAGEGLEDCEKDYLLIIKKMVEKRLTPRKITLNNLGKGKEEALKWCTLNEIYHTAAKLQVVSSQYSEKTRIKNIF